MKLKLSSSHSLVLTLYQFKIDQLRIELVSHASLYLFQLWGTEDIYVYGMDIDIVDLGSCLSVFMSE